MEFEFELLTLSNTEEMRDPVETKLELELPEILELDFIFRYKFTDSFMNELLEFSKIHQYDDRVSFKEAWNIWVKENSETVLNEINRLLELGYSGNIEEKMFKSARYYFRKKSIEKKTPQVRRKYIGVTKELLESMDTHIRENIMKDDYMPKNGFVDFCLNNTIILKETVTKICSDKTMDSDAKTIENKIKKTYKNRYFRIINNKK